MDSPKYALESGKQASLNNLFVILVPRFLGVSRHATQSRSNNNPNVWRSVNDVTVTVCVDSFDILRTSESGTALSGNGERGTAPAASVRSLDTIEKNNLFNRIAPQIFLRTSIRDPVRDLMVEVVASVPTFYINRRYILESKRKENNNRVIRRKTVAVSNGSINGL